LPILNDAIRPKILELNIVDELIAIDNMDVLSKNGFVIQVDKEAQGDERPKVRLVAQPMSKDTMFDMKGQCNCCAYTRAHVSAILAKTLRRFCIR
jgi:hypothetical protein